MKRKCWACFSQINIDPSSLPQECPSCGGAKFFRTTKDLDDTTVPGDARVVIEMNALGQGVHLACMWFPEKPLTATEVARIMGVDKARISRLLAQGAFPNARRVGHVWQIPLGDVHDYMAQRAHRRAKSSKGGGKR